MPHLPVPVPPIEQTQLRARREELLGGWGVGYVHEDKFWESESKGEAVYGWGTQIARGPFKRSIRVWYDGLDDDIAIWSGGRYFEWRDLEDMKRVLSEIEVRLHALL